MEIKLLFLLNNIEYVNSTIIENLLFNVESIRLNYLTENCPITVGEPFDEWEMRDFIYQTNFIFETKIHYKLKPCKDSDKVIIEVTEIKESTSKDILSASQDGFGLQYPFAYHSPLLSGIFTPKISINNNVLLNNLSKSNSLFWCTGNFNIKHKFNHKHIIDIFDGNLGLNLSTNISELLRSFKISALRYFYILPNMSLLIVPFNFHKFFNKYEIQDEEVRKNIQKYLDNYIYKYGEIHIKKRLTFDENELFIRSYMKYFLHDDENTLKFALHLDDTIELSKNMKILFTIKGLYNSQNIQNKKNIYKHLSAINNKRDEILGLLWDYYDNMDEVGHSKDEDFESYLISKGVVLSKILLDIRLMLLVNIFKFKIPSFGLLEIYFHIFVNGNYDISNNIFRLSYGMGLMGIINNIRFIFSTGWRNKWLYENNKFNYKTPDLHEEKMKYGFNLEHVSI